VAFVAHCLLNQNSKVGDGAHCAGIYSPVVDVLRDQGWRIEQMPCPELAFIGLNRFWAVREQLDTIAYRKHCRRLAATVADMIAVRAGRGEEVVLIGVEGSPSMGVRITSSDRLGAAGRNGRRVHRSSPAARAYSSRSCGPNWAAGDCGWPRRRDTCLARPR